MRIHSSLFAITALAAIAAAQTTVLPNGFASTEGNSSSAHPFGRGNSANRVQYCYDSANMVAAGLSAPCFINTIEWRANTAATTLGGTHAGAGVTLVIGTAAFDHLSITNTFANNFAPGAVTHVLNPVSVATGAGTTPNNYTTMLTIPGGYFFDPAAGQDLLIEVVFPAGTWTGLGTNTTASAMDLHSATGVGGSRVFSTSNTAATGTLQPNLAAVIRLGWTPAPGAASNQSYGIGCGMKAGSFYEHIPTTPGFDLSNTAISLIRTPSGYSVMPGTTTFVAPSGTATNMLLGDDSIVSFSPSAAFPYPGGSATSLTVCSNGFISAGSVGNGTSFTPAPAAFLAWTNTAWAVWRDFITTTGGGGGDIWREEVGGVVYVTWLNVLGYNGQVAGVTPSTFQFQFELATGNVHIVFQSMDNVSISTWAGGEGWVIGYGTAGASGDPGSIDLSTAVPATFQVSGVEQGPLSLSAAPRPVINTLVTYTVGNIDATSLLSAHIVSIGGVDPGIDMTSFGAPGCWQYVDLSIASTFLIFGGPTGTNSFFVPNDSSLSGLPIDSQAASLVPGLNALGVSTSGAVVSTIGTL